MIPLFASIDDIFSSLSFFAAFFRRFHFHFSSDDAASTPSVILSCRALYAATATERAGRQVYLLPDYCLHADAAADDAS